MIRGSLKLKLHSAQLTRDVKTFGKMNTFATFEHKTSTHKSEICVSEGKEPSWDDCHFEFLIKNGDDTIQMILYSKNILKNKQIGKALLWIENLVKSGGADWWEDIGYDGKPAGKVHLSA